MAFVLSDSVSMEETVDDSIAANQENTRTYNRFSFTVHLQFLQGSPSLPYVVTLIFRACPSAKSTNTVYQSSIFSYYG